MSIESDHMEVRNARALPDSIPCERIALGEKADYKPCITRLPDGELLVVAYHQIANQEDGRLQKDTLLWRSSDGGKTWTPRAVIPLLGWEPYFSALKDGTLFISTCFLAQAVRNEEGYCHSLLHRSVDGGRTWDVTRVGREDLPEAAEDSEILVGRNVLELQDGTVVFGVGGGRGNEYLWRSSDGGRTWDKTRKCTCHGVDSTKLHFPLLAEAFYWEAPRGDILGIFRIDPTLFPPLPGTEIPQTESDHYERMVLFRSKDGGRNWYWDELGSYYGEMYPSVLRMQDERLLLTFTVRSAVPPRVPPLGVHAVLGVEEEDGFRFDFEHDRIIIDAKTPLEQYSGGGFGPTVQLDDGTLVTSYSYAGPGEWGTDFHCEVVRWRLP